jgi:hypothetical protein
MRIRDFRVGRDFLLPALVLAVAIWGISARDWQLALSAGSVFVFLAIWILRRAERVSMERRDKLLALPRRIPFGWMVAVSWMLALGMLVAGLALSGVAVELVFVAGVGFVMVGLAAFAVTHMFSGWTRE